MFHIKQFQSDQVARQFGCSGGDIVIVDDNWEVVPGEKTYTSYQRSAAQLRADELNNADVPDLFDDID